MGTGNGNRWGSVLVQGRSVLVQGSVLLMVTVSVKGSALVNTINKKYLRQSEPATRHKPRSKESPEHPSSIHTT